MNKSPVKATKMMDEMKLFKRREQQHGCRQEINCLLRYFLFSVNFFVWFASTGTALLGFYLYAKDFRPVVEAVDFFLNPCVLLVLLGSTVGVVSLLGCAGALRENVCLLKCFSLVLFVAYVLLVLCGFLAFILFYSDSSVGLSLRTLLSSALERYHVNDNIKDVVDYMQSQLQCCGVGSHGYREWSLNALFNCTDHNPAPERCAVPHSCCRRPTADGNNGQPPLPSIVCGFGAQEKPITDLLGSIHSEGCLQPLQKLFESHALLFGALIGAAILPVCLCVMLSNLLGRQIVRQRYLLDRQARRELRHARRMKHRFRDPFDPPAIVHLYDELRMPTPVPLSQADNCCQSKLTQEHLLGTDHQQQQQQQQQQHCCAKEKISQADQQPLSTKPTNNHQTSHPNNRQNKRRSRRQLSDDCNATLPVNSTPDSNPCD
ncbi:Tetraspanin-5 [Trichinella pseudospiralis]|uniref:Tetraspanin-5 n=1 Tax=Trichinella pseudospiralis TaxID=6337 RepID=A0A0V1FM50_TRIPS|nr:Tetraspanin-5 [Trichinella pseudospiralis]KRY87129.1 Tetraspanin-5 [Trichinella pseudospiralis]